MYDINADILIHQVHKQTRYKHKHKCFPRSQKHLDLRIISELQTKVHFLTQTNPCSNHVQKMSHCNCGLLQTHMHICDFFVQFHCLSVYLSYVSQKNEQFI